MPVPHDRTGRAVWNLVDFPILRGVCLSTGATVLSRFQADEWMQRVPTITLARLNHYGGESLASTSLLSTGSVHAELLMERMEPDGPTSKRHRYYRYLLARVRDGRWFQAGPDKSFAEGFRHHEAERPAMLDDLLLRSTSTGW